LPPTKKIESTHPRLRELGSCEKMLILYLTNLVLLSKKNDAVKAIDTYGKRLYEKELLEANLRRIKALALMFRRKMDAWDSAVKGIKQLVKANIIS
jgi:hypothetical protein